MSPTLAARRLHSAENELRAAVRDGRARDAAAWRIAVEVLRHFAGPGGHPTAPASQSSVRS